METIWLLELLLVAVPICLYGLVPTGGYDPEAERKWGQKIPVAFVFRRKGRNRSGFVVTGQLRRDKFVQYPIGIKSPIPPEVREVLQKEEKQGSKLVLVGILRHLNPTTVSDDLGGKNDSALS